MEELCSIISGVLIMRKQTKNIALFENWNSFAIAILLAIQPIAKSNWTELAKTSDLESIQRWATINSPSGGE